MAAKLTKVMRGWYATPDGTVAVVVDGIDFTGVGRRDGDGLDAGVTGGEWALLVDERGRLRVDHQAGRDFGWFETKVEAVMEGRRRGLLVR
jgi:hypothetical protein